MYDGGKIIVGLIIFLGLVTFPFYTNIGKSLPEPPPEFDAPEVHTDVNMRAEHMKVLMKWRDEVVRHDTRFTVLGDIEVEKSLQNGCLDCHSKREFCDVCHTYAGVKPYCWRCHFVKEEE